MFRAAGMICSCCQNEVNMQKQHFGLAAAILVVLSVAAADGRDQKHERTKSAIDAVFDGLVRPNDPGIAVLIRYGGKDSFRESHGVRDLRSKAKIDAHTNFRLASFTKQFTAVAIMLLVHDGKLRYDETLTEVFPDFPAYGKIGEDFRERFVVAEFSIVHQQHDGHGRELFGEGGEPEIRMRIDLRFRTEIAYPVGFPKTVFSSVTD